MWTEDGRTTEASHTISSPRAFGSGELKTAQLHPWLPFGIPVAQWIQHWPTALAIPSSIFSALKEIPLHIASHSPNMTDMHTVEKDVKLQVIHLSAILSYVPFKCNVFKDRKVTFSFCFTVLVRKFVPNFRTKWPSCSKHR